MDGANMNAQVGLSSPGEIGADVCHLNLHKTFCIPHGGGGPGVGPIGVAEHLAPFLPGREAEKIDRLCRPLGSASILVITWMYIAHDGGEGAHRRHQARDPQRQLHRQAARRSSTRCSTGATSGLVAHECIIDLRPIKDDTGISVEDVAKRLMDYGFHAPTMSWPVPGR